MKTDKMVVTWMLLTFCVASTFGAVISKNPGVVFEPTTLGRSVCGRVWITVHSPEIRVTTTNVIRDAIELNWDYTGCPDFYRRIGLFDFQPGALSWNQALVVHDITTSTGRIITRTPLGATTLPGGWDSGQGTTGGQCLWPWVGAGTDYITIINCLKIQPTWMQDYAVQINHLRLGELALPGTHNSGAWRFDTEISNAARDSFVLCQDRSIWEQLVYGIRYFDFRIGFYGIYSNEDDRYWVNHNMVRIRPLVPILREIRRFLDATREIVVLDLHNFPVGFYNNNNPIREVHVGLLNIIQRELGPHIAAATGFPWTFGSRGPLLSQFINADRRLIIPYIDNIIVNENNWLFPRLPHLWAQTNNVDQLFNFLNSNLLTQNPRPSERNPMHAAMVQTTPSALDIVLGRGTIRQNADQVNFRVTSNLGNQWRFTANVIASDFFLGNDVVETSIIVNQERGGQMNKL